jgi:molybdenum cofactor cytidylyltransferase
MSASPNEVYAVILAAGASRRLGSPKQLLPWQGKTLLEHAIANLQSVFADRVLVVLGAEAELIVSSIELGGVKTVINPDWQQGMSGSIRLGLSALPTTAKAALLVLCDQPLITASHYQSLLQSWQANPEQIIASRYHDNIGVPALFPRPFFPALQNLTGDRGAKPLLQSHAERVLTIPLAHAALDIDTDEDFRRLLASS